MKDIMLPPGDWAPAPDAPELFMVSRKGELFSLRSNKVVALNPVGKGYLAHITKVGGRQGETKVLKAHIQVAKAFHPNPENKPLVNHKNGIKSCNEDWNVEWATHQENVKHAIDTGLSPKIPPSEVCISGNIVREILENEHGPSRDIAERYGVSKTTVQRIRNNPAKYLSLTMNKVPVV